MVTDVNYPTDTLNWYYFKKTFIAKGNEQFITIGYFFDTLSIDTLYLGFLSSSMAYFYIDNVKIVEDTSGPIIPTIFTPNGDGINDIFKIIGLGNEDEVFIYNRWGVKIYEFTATNNGWGGKTTSGGKCYDGVYYYVIERKNKPSLNGFIQLLN